MNYFCKILPGRTLPVLPVLSGELWKAQAQLQAFLAEVHAEAQAHVQVAQVQVSEVSNNEKR